MVRACGPVRIIPQKTGIAFQARVRFVGVFPRKKYLLCGLWLARRHDHPRFRKILNPAPRCYLHELRLDSQKELDREARGWIREAYAVGEQKHLE